MTFSICAIDPETDEIGIAVQSKWLAIGAYVPWARAGVGAVATQSFFNVTYGPNGLDLLAAGLTPSEVILRLTVADDGRAKRQVAVLDAKGQSAVHTGSECMEWAGHLTCDGCSVQGNALTGSSVLQAMAADFASASGTLAERLVAALVAGQREGGDRRGMQSAAVLVVRENGGMHGFGDRLVDLRVDDHPQPIDELRRLVRLCGK